MKKVRSIGAGRVFVPLFVAVVLCSALPAHTLFADPVVFEAVNRAVLSAQRSGVLVKMSYDVGDSVKKGAVIARVDTGELALRKKRTELGLKYLNSQVTDITNLKKKGLATNEDLQKSLMERDVTRTDLEILKRLVSKSSVRAPYACVVVKKHMQAHEWVTEGKEVVEVVDTTKLRAVANMQSSLAVGLKKGDKHEFRVSDLNITVSGTVAAVVPDVDELSNTARVVWTVEKPGKDLVAGMKGEVSIGQ